MAHHRATRPPASASRSPTCRPRRDHLSRLGDLGREHCDKIAVRVPTGERLVEDTRAVGDSLVPVAKCGIRRRGCLPPQDLEHATAATSGREIIGPCLGHRHTTSGKQLVGHRRAQANGQHPLHEAAPRQPARPDAVDRTREVRVLPLLPPAASVSAPSFTRALAPRPGDSRPHFLRTDNSRGRRMIVRPFLPAHIPGPPPPRPALSSPSD